MPLSQIHSSWRHITQFRDIVAPSHSNISIHIPHFGHPVLGRQPILFIRGAHQELPCNPHRIHRHERNCATPARLAD